jgi:hypothetical protein
MDSNHQPKPRKEMPMSIIDNKALKEKIDASVTSIRAIKGDKFASLVGFLVSAQHLSNMIATVSRLLPDDKRFIVQTQAVNTLALATTLLAEAYELSEEDLKELMQWSETLTKMVEEEITKGEQ